MPDDRKISRSKRIDDDALRRMWTAGVSSTIIAENFGVKRHAVSKRARQLELPPRTSAHRQSLHNPPPPPPRAPVKGYAAVVATAAREGLTLAQAMQRFHRSRA